MSLGRIGDYEILERIGSGGMGVVFLARDIGLDVPRAIKVIAPEHADKPEYRTRLRLEAHTVARLQHPNIALCHHFGEAVPVPADLLGPPGPEGSRPVFFMVMEYVPGTDLREYTARRQLPVPEVLRILRQIASGLEAAHLAHVIHRDIKPGNIRLTQGGEVKILDFGVARSDPAHDAVTWAPTTGISGGALVGTPRYMAPEQARRRTTSEQSDLYSLGLVMYELLAGHQPYAHGDPGWESDDPMMWAVDPLDRSRHDLRPQLVRIVDRLLQFDPANRYADAGQLRLDLERLDRPPQRIKQWVIAGLGIAFLGCAARDLPAWMEIKNSPAARNVAVFDLETASMDPGLQQLAAGLATDICDGLSGVHGINTQRLPRRLTPGTVRDSLGAGSLLRGTLARTDATSDWLDIELLDTGSGRPRWTAGYYLGPGDWFGIRRQIIASVTQRVTRVRRGERPLPGSREPKATASDLYLRGLAYLNDVNRRDAPDSAAAIFDRALQLDPAFAEAWAAQARAQW
jgi:hypothetical protein